MNAVTTLCSNSFRLNANAQLEPYCEYAVLVAVCVEAPACFCVLEGSMERTGFWADQRVREVSATQSCDGFDASDALTGNTCPACFYFRDGGCHNAVASNLRVATKQADEVFFAESLFA